MVDVFDEVEEELRRERYNALFRKWGPWVLGGAVAIVAGAMGWVLWDGARTSAAEEASNAYFDAAELFENGDFAAAESAFGELAAGESRGYATLALLRQGEIALSENRTAEAAQLFEQAAERAPEPLTRQLAQYKAALALFDELSYDDLSVRLTPLTEGEALFGALARELIAAAAMRDERWEEARSAYTLLAVSLDAPPGVSRRASEALVYIRQNAPESIAETIPETPEPAVEPEEGADLLPADAVATDTEEGGQ